MGLFWCASSLVCVPSVQISICRNNTFAVIQVQGSSVLCFHSINSWEMNGAPFPLRNKEHLGNFSSLHNGNNAF